jgi:hypothetical protein
MGVRSIAFPVFLRAKGDKELREFESLKQIQGWIEPIDVENKEYEGWDSEGYPIDLQLGAENAITAGLLKDIAEVQALKKAFTDFAGLEEVPVVWNENSVDVHKTYSAVKNGVDEARRKKPWLRRIINRF